MSEETKQPLPDGEPPETVQESTECAESTGSAENTPEDAQNPSAAPESADSAEPADSETGEPAASETSAEAETAGNAAASADGKTGSEKKAEGKTKIWDRISGGKEKTVTLSLKEKKALEAAAGEAAEKQEQLLRITAEYQNYRNRTAREKERTYQNAKMDTIQPFLAVYDNLVRAVGAEGGADSPHKKGLEMIFSQFQEVLSGLGVKKIEAQGQPFDPGLHNAVMRIEDETLGEGIVAEVLQDGFQLGDRVLRVATVKVAN